ncbi:MAG TPA: hypothetical protein VN224_03025 [Xanthomonadales bacterium]|nr:hypothetical protein [Xanthomonadales bacterium]
MVIGNRTPAQHPWFRRSFRRAPEKPSPGDEAEGKTTVGGDIGHSEDLDV